jgi:hypothetical protein
MTAEMSEHNSEKAAGNSFMGSGIGFRLAVAALCLALLWIGVIWALA